MSQPLLEIITQRSRRFRIWCQTRVSTN